jgi:hypothetical protein
MRNAKEFAEEIRSAVEDELRDSLCSESGSRNVVVLQPDSAAGGVEFDYKWRDGHVEHIEENEETGKRFVVRLSLRVVVESVREEDI